MDEFNPAQTEPQGNVAGEGQQAGGLSPQQQVQYQPKKITPVPVGEKRSLLKRSWFWILIILLILLVLGIGFLWIFVIPSFRQSTPTGEVSETQLGQVQPPPPAIRTGQNSVVIKDQPVTEGLQLHIEKVEVNTNAFLAIRMPSAGIGEVPGLLIATSSILVPDIYRDFDLPMLDSDLLDQFQLARIKAGGLAYATLYKDVNGNAFYDPETDNEVLKGALGREIRVEFNLLGGGQVQNE